MAQAEGATRQDRRTARMRRAAWPALALLMFGACGAYGTREEGERLAERYFTDAAAENYDAVLTLYAPQFFAATPRAQFRTVLSDMHEHCGAPQSHALSGWSSSASFTDGSARLNLIYDVHYARCRVTETLGMSSSQGAPLKIIAHHLQVTAAGSAERSGSQTV